MSSNLSSYLVIAGSVLAGVVWGRLSSRLPIPEWLRLLTIFLWTGMLGLGAMLIGCVVMHSWTAPAVVEAAALGPLAVLRLAVGEACIWFLLGAVFGLPASLGWVIGYRQPASG
jgi:hypothetical protein